MVRVAVVGHVEWVDFVEVSRLPRQGEVLHATAGFARAAGGGGVAASVLADLGAEVDFFCALGQDAQGRAAAEQLAQRGIRLQVAWRSEPTRRAITLLEHGGERTIVTIGERLEPLGSDPLEWERLKDAQGVYFTAGDGGALVHARQARVLLATPRARHGLAGKLPGAGTADVRKPIDALIYSAHDLDEAGWARTLGDRARLLVQTRGLEGGIWTGEEQGSWKAAPAPGPPRDAYGCGDSFAAGFTLGLAERRSVAEAAELGAQCGARCLTHVGAP